MSVHSSSVSLALASLVLFAACTNSRRINVAQVADYDEVSVTTNDGITRLFIEPSLGPDSLRGYLNQHALDVDVTWAVPLNQVTEVQVKQANTSGTIGLVVGLAAIGVGIWALVTVLDDISSRT